MPCIPDDAQVEGLAQLLDQRAVPFDGLNIESLDGYLSSMVLSPDDIAIEEWQPPVWGRAGAAVPTAPTNALAWRQSCKRPSCTH